MATNLFAQPTGNSSTIKALVEFKAGKMTFSNNRVTPIKRKGLVQLTQSPDSLIHFIWKDRSSGATEDDLIIFPEEATFKRITQCTTGRVYLLEFKSSTKKHFFWLQEPSDEKDEENCTKINQYINNPPSGGNGLEGMSNIGGLDQNTLFQMLGGANPGLIRPISQTTPQTPQSNAPSTSRPNPSTAAVGVTDLQSILSGMIPPNQQQQQQSTNSLPAVLAADNVLPLLMNNPALMNELLQHLPEERRTPEEVVQLLRSPQFLHSLTAFSSALQSGQLPHIINQFNQQSGTPSNPNANPIDALLQSLQNLAPSSTNQSNTNPPNPNPSTQPPSDQKDKTDKDKDDKMDTN